MLNIITSAVLNITFNDFNQWVDKFELVQQSTSTIVYSKETSILASESIDVSSYTPGLYNLLIYYGIESRTILIQVN